MDSIGDVSRKFRSYILVRISDPEHSVCVSRTGVVDVAVVDGSPETNFWGLASRGRYQWHNAMQMWLCMYRLCELLCCQRTLLRIFIRTQISKVHRTNQTYDTRSETHISGGRILVPSWGILLGTKPTAQRRRLQSQTNA